MHVGALASLVTLAVVVTAVSSAGYPTPSVFSSVSLYPSGEPRCPPTVVSASAVFACVRDTQLNRSFAMYVNPIAGTVGPSAPLGNGSSFVFPPTPLSNTTAVVYSTYPDSFYTLVSSVPTATNFFADRLGTPTAVAVDTDRSIAFVPFGFDQRALADSIVAYAVTPANHAGNGQGPMQTALWTNRYTLPADYPYTTEVWSPVYYRGALYVLISNVLTCYNAETGLQLWNVSNPCGLATPPASMLELFVATYGADANGALDAFLIFGNTTNEDDGPSCTLCRLSHSTPGKVEWTASLPYDATVRDVTGAAGTLLLTVSVPELDAAHSLVTIAFDAASGTYPGGYVNRDIAADYYNLPALLPVPLPGCTATIALQVQGVLQALCTSDLTSAVWVANTPCFYRAAADPVTGDIVCVDRFASVSRVNATDGTVVWQVAVAAAFAATVHGNHAWAVDQSATLWAFAVQLPGPPQGTPAGPLSGGEVVLVIFVVIFVGSLAGAIGFAYVQRVRRRRRDAGSYTKVNSTGLTSSSYGAAAE